MKDNLSELQPFSFSRRAHKKTTSGCSCCFVVVVVAVVVLDTVAVAVVVVFVIVVIVIVPDRRSRIIPEVVLVRRWAVGVLGIRRGEGLVEWWDNGGQFTSNLRPRWTNPVTARRVPSK